MAVQPVSAEVVSAQRVREGRLARIGRLAWLLSLPLAGFGALLAFLPAEARALWVVLLVALTIVGVPLLTLAVLGIVRVGAIERWRRGSVVLDEGGLSVGDERIPRSELAGAWSVADDELEVITRAGDELRFVFTNPAHLARFGAQLRAAIGRDRSWAIGDGQPTWRTMRKAFAAYAPMAVAATLGALSPWLLPALPLAAAIGWVLGRGRRRVRFGADGFTIEGRFRSRYVPYQDVTHAGMSAGVSGLSVYVQLDHGPSLSVLGGLDAARAGVLVALIEEGTTMVAEGREVGALLNEHQNASEDELLARLIRGPRAEHYREPAIGADRLREVVRNPATTSSARIAAAIALREAPGGRAELRVAADVTDDPDVRTALETLAEEQLDELRGRELLRRIAR